MLGLSRGFLGFNIGNRNNTKEDSLMRVLQEAKEAQKRQDFMAAEVCYHDALKIAEEMLQSKKFTERTYIFAKTNIYDNLANMALAQGHLETAEKLYVETMKGCLQQGFSKQHNAVIELSIKLASIYAMLDQNEKAEQGLQFCIHTQEAKVTTQKAKKDSGVLVSPTQITEPSQEEKLEALRAENEEDTEALLGLSLETYGRFLMGQRRFSEAVTVLERARSVAQNVLDTDRGQYLILINDLATAHILLRHYDEAVAILKGAIATASKSNSPELPVLYCNLGAAFLRTSRLEEAETACTKGQDLAKKGHNPMATTMSQKCLEKVGQARKS